MRKVNLQVIRPWVTKKSCRTPRFELVVEYAMGLLEDESQTVKSRHPFCLTTPEPKKNADQPHWFSH